MSRQRRRRASVSLFHALEVRQITVASADVHEIIQLRLMQGGTSGGYAGHEMQISGMEMLWLAESSSTVNEDRGVQWS